MNDFFGLFQIWSISQMTASDPKERLFSRKVVVDFTHFKIAALNKQGLRTDTTYLYFFVGNVGSFANRFIKNYKTYLHVEAWKGPLKIYLHVFVDFFVLFLHLV